MLNDFACVGRLTAEPELKQAMNGDTYANFTVAVSRSYTKQNGERETDFLRMIAWKQKAEFVARNFHKGSPISVRGSVQVRNYEDKDGVKRELYQIYVDDVSFVPGDQRNNDDMTTNQVRARGGYNANASQSSQSGYGGYGGYGGNNYHNNNTNGANGANRGYGPYAAHDNRFGGDNGQTLPEEFPEPNEGLPF